MRWQRLNTLRNRLVLLFFVITGAAVGFVYLYVVPQLESSLTTEKLTRLESRGKGQQARIERAMRLGLSEQRLAALEVDLQLAAVDRLRMRVAGSGHA